MISVLIPTITGREQFLFATMRAYRNTTPDVQIVVVKNKPCVGVGWNEAAEQAEGDYVHLTADDIVPHEGWWREGCRVCDQGDLPAPLIYNTDGTVQSCGEYGDMIRPDGEETEFTRIPLMSKAQWELIRPIIPTHYYTDNWVSHKGRLHGMRTVITAGYTFTHHYAPIGRVDERMASDRAEYVRYVKEGYP